MEILSNDWYVSRVMDKGWYVLESPWSIFVWWYSSVKEVYDKYTNVLPHVGRNESGWYLQFFDTCLILFLRIRATFYIKHKTIDLLKNHICSKKSFSWIIQIVKFK